MVLWKLVKCKFQPAPDSQNVENCLRWVWTETVFEKGPSLDCFLEREWKLVLSDQILSINRWDCFLWLQGLKKNYNVTFSKWFTIIFKVNNFLQKANNYSTKISQTLTFFDNCDACSFLHDIGNMLLPSTCTRNQSEFEQQGAKQSTIWYLSSTLFKLSNIPFFAMSSIWQLWSH